MLEQLFEFLQQTIFILPNYAWLLIGAFAMLLYGWVDES
jgi:hypothetical protein